MYILLKNDGTSFYLKNNSTYTVGRKGTDFELNDNTVSRRHAKIKIKDKLVYVEDLKSANGTYLNGNLLAPNAEADVKVGNEIKFGSKNSIFLLKKDELVVTSSQLGMAEQLELRTLICNMSGTFSASWSTNCTHVVTESLVLTVKILCALVLKQHIVTLAYFKQREKQISKNGKLPNHLTFQPEMGDDNFRKKQKIDYTLDRRRLFKNKVFVFESEISLKKMEELVKLAEGKSVLYNQKPVPKSKLLSTNPEYLLIITTENTQSINTKFNQCVKYLMEHKRRPIPLPEIASAIMVGNCDTDCNPTFERATKSDLSCPLIESKDILVPETQTQKSTSSTTAESMVVPDSDSEGSSDVNSRSSRNKTSSIKKKKNLSIDIDAIPETINESSRTQESTDDVDTVTSNRKKKPFKVTERSARNKALPKNLSIDVDAIPEKNISTDKVLSIDIQEIGNESDKTLTNKKRKPDEVVESAVNKKAKIPTSTQNTDSDVIEIDDDSFEEPSPIKKCVKRKMESPIKDEASTSFGFSKKKKVDNPFENMFQGQKTRKKSTNLSQTNLHSFFGNTSTQNTKRKLEDKEENNPFKKTVEKKVKNNPFAKVFSKTFGSDVERKSKYVKDRMEENDDADSFTIIDDDEQELKNSKKLPIPVESIKTQNDVDVILTSTHVEGNDVKPNFSMISAINEPLRSSKFEPLDPIDETDPTINDSPQWLSKSTKSQPLKTTDGTVDDALEEYIKSFKSIVLIDDSLIVRRPMADLPRNPTASLNDTNVKNFKKFKKSTTKLQTTMIMKDDMRRVVCNTSIGSYDDLPQEELDVDQPVVLSPLKKISKRSIKNKTKRFLFDFA